MSFASVEDLRTRLRVDVDHIEAQAVLDGATDEITAACPSWQLSEVVGDTVDLQGSGLAYLLLPLPPVTSVSAVVDEDGDAVTGWTLKSTVRNRVRQDRLDLETSYWDVDVVYTVTYTHGFTDDTLPGFLKEMCLRLAMRMWVNPEQVMQKRRGDYSMSFGSSAVETSGLTKYELRMLSKKGLRKTSQ